MRLSLAPPGIAVSTASAPPRLSTPLTSSAPGRRPRASDGDDTGSVTRRPDRETREDESRRVVSRRCSRAARGVQSERELSYLLLHENTALDRRHHADLYGGRGRLEASAHP